MGLACNNDILIGVIHHSAEAFINLICLIKITIKMLVLDLLAQNHRWLPFC